MKPDRQQFVDDDRPKCPDDGTCHHQCGSGPCFRVAGCGPLSNVYPGDQWPDSVNISERIKKLRRSNNKSAREIAQLQRAVDGTVAESHREQLWKAEWEQISRTAAEIQRDRDRLLGTIETTRSTLVRFRLWVDLFVDKPERLSEQISHLIKRIDGTMQPHEEHSDASLTGGICDVCDRVIEESV